MFVAFTFSSILVFGLLLMAERNTLWRVAFGTGLAIQALVYTIIIRFDRICAREMQQAYTTLYDPNIPEALRSSFALVDDETGVILGRLDQISQFEVEALREIARARIKLVSPDRKLVELPKYNMLSVRQGIVWKIRNKPLYETNLTDARQFGKVQALKDISRIDET